MSLLLPFGIANAGTVICDGTNDNVEIQAEIDGISDGGTVTLSGSCVLGANITIDEDKSIKITGTGGASLDFKGNSINITMYKTKVIEISNLTLTTSTGTATTPDHIYIGQSGDECVCGDPELSDGCQNLINIHDNTITYVNLTIQTNISGVIWRNTFTGELPWSAIFTFQSDMCKYGSHTWGKAANFGGSDFIFVEGNTVASTSWDTGRPFVDGRGGGRHVVRFNTTSNFGVGFHDACTNGIRGTRASEVYNNSFYSNDQIYNYWYSRGAALRMYSNYFHVGSRSNSGVYPMTITAYRDADGDTDCAGVWNSACNGSAGKFCIASGASCTGTGDGTCGEGNGPCVDIDTTIGGRSNTYLCRDQTGASADDVNGAQAQETSYAWANYYCSGHFYDANLASANGTNAGGCVVSSPSGWSHRDFIASDVGLPIRIKTATGWTAGLYSVVSVADGQATLDRACGTSDTLSSGNAILSTCEGTGVSWNLMTYSNIVEDEATILENVDIAVSETKPEAISAYTAYQCPHPLADPSGSYDCDETTYGTAGYWVAKKGASVTISSGAAMSIGSGAVMTLQ